MAPPPGARPSFDQKTERMKAEAMVSLAESLAKLGDVVERVVNTLVEDDRPACCEGCRGREG
jgi:hypothetical protein